VTDEVFLPPRNGSGEVYARTADDYRRAGYRVCCVSFYRDAARARGAQTAYAKVFADHFMLPGPNGGGDWRGRLGLAAREMSRALTGDCFPVNPWLARRLRSQGDAFDAFIRRNGVTEVYFHKPHAVLLLKPLLGHLAQTRKVMDIHDDFVERECLYRRAYDAFFSAIPPGEIARGHLKFYVRHRFSRLDVAQSRRTERRLLAVCDEVWFSSADEHARYSGWAADLPRLVLRPRRFQPPAPRARAGAPIFDAGFVGSEDVMNLDAVRHFRDAILPRVRAHAPGFRWLVAGAVAGKAAELLRGTPGVTLWPYLPDMAAFYDAVALVVVPLRFGTGTAIKVLEGLAFGCPIVSTTVGVRGMSAEECAGVAVADDPADFAQACVDRLAAIGRPQPERGAAQ
jgi:glycosyltransferase involved in cell wall biosynthesis